MNSLSKSVAENPASSKSDLEEGSVESGQTINIPEHGDRHVPFVFQPPTPHELLPKLQSMVKPRQDDVIIMAFNRSGTHWTHEIVWMLVHGSTDPAPRQKDFFLEMLSPEQFQKIESPRVLNCHYPYPTDIADILKDMKVIWVTRESRDAIVSMYSTFIQSFLTWGEFWKRYHSILQDGSNEAPNWFSIYHGFRKYLGDENACAARSCPVLDLKYEEMKASPMDHIQKIAAYLGVHRSPEFLQEVLRKTDFKAMKKIYHENEHLHDVNAYGFVTDLYRKGQVGDWKNWFTVAQNEQFEELYRREMAQYEDV